MKVGTKLKRRPELTTGTAQWWTKWTRYDQATGCVLWTGSVCPLGYARTHWRGKGGVLIHRIAYEQTHGPIDPGLVICHRCDTPNCVNPAHLFAGTQKDNLRDMFAKGRARPQGRTTAPLTVFPAVSARVLRAQRRPLNKPLDAVTVSACARVDYRLHLIGTTADSNPLPVETPAWCRVRNVPPQRPTQAIVLYRRPESWTSDKVRYQADGAMVAASLDTGGRA